jgi:hypothetical protein
MKMLKSLFAIIGCLLIPITMTQCGTTKSDLQELPFQTSEVYFKQWIAGVQGGGSGIDLYILITDMSDGIQLQKAFFKGKVAPLNLTDGNVFVAHFLTDLNNERDLTLHGDAIEESVNTPAAPEPFPFPLNADEAGISYKENGILKYTKLANIIEKESIPRPSAPPRGDIDKG